MLLYKKVSYQLIVKDYLRGYKMFSWIYKKFNINLTQF